MNYSNIDTRTYTTQVPTVPDYKRMPRTTMMPTPALGVVPATRKLDLTAMNNKLQYRKQIEAPLRADEDKVSLYPVVDGELSQDAMLMVTAMHNEDKVR